MFDLCHDFPPAGPLGQEIEEGGVLNAAVLDDLRHAVGEHAVGEGLQHLRVHEDQLGLPEGPGQVLPGPQVHRHLATHGGVHLGQQGGGDLDEIHPPQDGGGRKASQIAYHAAAQGHYRVGAGEAEVHHVLPELGEHGGGLAALPGGDLLAGRLKAGLLQALHHPSQVEGGHIGVGHHKEAGTPGEHAAAQLARPVQGAPFDVDVIGPSGQVYPQCFHGRSSLSSGPHARRAGSPPSS